MVIFYKKWKKYNEIQLTKNKMDLNIRKITNDKPSPDDFDYCIPGTPYSKYLILLPNNLCSR